MSWSEEEKDDFHKHSSNKQIYSTALFRNSELRPF